MKKKKLIVQKFGGTSLATIDKIKKAAEKIKKEIKLKNNVIVVVSAIGKTTDKLQSLINDINRNGDKKEIDFILSSGEQASSGLMSLALNKMGVKARSFAGWQIPILTNMSYGKAKILDIDKQFINSQLKNGVTPVIAGFQGISEEMRVATIGRGGSDTTAVALASKFSADRCDIFTDVDGVFTADPNLVRDAKKINQLTYEEMLEMSSVGAQVLEPRSVSLAKQNNVSLVVRSSFKKVSGTKIVKSRNILEKRNISGIVFSKNDSKITLLGIPDKPGVAAKIFGSLANEDINVDMIVQNISTDGKFSDLTFTVSENDLYKATKSINDIKKEIGIKRILPDQKVAKISIVGIGMRTNAGIAEDMFKTLGKEKINIDLISTSEIKISVLISRKHLIKAVNVLHKSFKLSKS